MTEIENTPDRLVLEHLPWRFALVLVAAMVGLFSFAASWLAAGDMWQGLGGMTGVALLAVVFWAFVRRSVVIFDRKTGHVTWRVQGLSGQSETVRPLGRVQRADVEGRRGFTGRTFATGRRPMLRLLPGEGDTVMPLHAHYAAGTGPHRIVATVNAWLSVGT